MVRAAQQSSGTSTLSQRRIASFFGIFCLSRSPSPSSGFRREFHCTLQRRSPVIRRIGSGGPCSRRRSRAILDSLHAFRPALTGKTPPNRLNGISAPIRAVAWEGACPGVVWHDGRSANAGFTPHADALELAQFCEAIDTDNTGDGEAGY